MMMSAKASEQHAAGGQHQHRFPDDGREIMTVDINEWRNAAIPTISEFQRKMTLESRTLTIDCSLSYFENEILGNRIPGARYVHVLLRD